MAGTFREPYNSNSDSDRISEELFNAFNLDDFDDDRETRVRGKSSAPAAPKKSSAPSRKRRRKKDRQLMVMVGLCVLGFLLVAEILCGIFIWKLPVLPAIAVIIMNLAIGLILGHALIIAPILILAVEIAAGVFASQLLLAVLGAVLLVIAKVFCYLLR